MHSFFHHMHFVQTLENTSHASISKSFALKHLIFYPIFHKLFGEVPMCILCVCAYTYIYICVCVHRKSCCPIHNWEIGKSNICRTGSGLQTQAGFLCCSLEKTCFIFRSHHLTHLFIVKPFNSLHEAICIPQKDVLCSNLPIKMGITSSKHLPSNSMFDQTTGHCPLTKLSHRIYLYSYHLVL